MFGLGLPEIIILLVIVLLVFGGKRIPQLGRSIGEGIVNFKKALKNEKVRDVEKIEEDENKKS